jgi:hypothetical protein
LLKVLDLYRQQSGPHSADGRRHEEEVAVSGRFRLERESNPFFVLNLVKMHGAPFQAMKPVLLL